MVQLYKKIVTGLIVLCFLLYPQSTGLGADTKAKRIRFTPAGTIEATNVQDAIEEAASEAAVGGDNVTVAGTAIDTTADFVDDGDIDFTLVDGGAGGPDAIKADIKSDVIVPNNFAFSQDFGDVNTDAGGALRYGGDSIDDTHINWGSMTYLGEEGEVLITAYTARTAFESGDSLLIYEAGVGAREIDYDDLPAGGTGSMTTVKEEDTPVGDADIVILDFGPGFDMAETPDTEIQITLDMSEISPTITSRWTFAGEDTGTDVIGLNIDWAGVDPTNGQVEGDIWYDSSANVYKGYTTHEIILGSSEEPGVITAKKGSAGTISAGDAVYISGFNGTDLTVELADADDTSKMPAVGIAEGTINSGTAGTVATFGLMEDVVNTSGWSVGDGVYITVTGTTGNTLTNSRPTGATTLIQRIGTVASSAAPGDIFIAGALRSNDEENITEAYIFVGNADEKPVGVAMSGDVTIIADGTTTIGTNTVQTDEIDLSISPTWTGTHDYGGANLEAPNTAGDVAVGTAGQLAVDTTQKQLAVGDGSVEYVIPLRHIIQGQLGTGDFDADPDVFILSLDSDVYPNGIVITEWTVDCNEADPSVELNANLKFADDRGAGAFPGASQTLIDVLDTTTGNSSENTMSNSDLTTGVITTGKEIYVLIDADIVSDTTLFRVKIHFYIPES